MQLEGSACAKNPHKAGDSICAYYLQH